ncbi:hypothetical protein GGI24_002175 [Coemansia furcata]|nr:hypothetical protein GGI24_002175 [Coemansia furcata]
MACKSADCIDQTATLHQAANDLDDADVQAAAGSIEQLGYLTPNIIPMLAPCASYAPSLASPLGRYSMHLLPNPSYLYSLNEPLNVPQVPQIPQLYTSLQSQCGKEKMLDNEKS